VDFFHKQGLDYVSCSPFRVPIARQGLSLLPSQSDCLPMRVDVQIPTCASSLASYWFPFQLNLTVCA